MGGRQARLERLIDCPRYAIAHRHQPTKPKRAAAEPFRASLGCCPHLACSATELIIMGQTRGATRIDRDALFSLKQRDRIRSSDRTRRQKRWRCSCFGPLAHHSFAQSLTHRLARAFAFDSSLVARSCSLIQLLRLSLVHQPLDPPARSVRRTALEMSVLRLGLSVLLSSSMVLALGAGRFPCTTSCNNLQPTGDESGVDSAGLKSDEPTPQGATCRLSFCGYAGAPCSSDENCDAGYCGKDGTCKGGFGQACHGDDSLCSGYIYCSDRDYQPTNSDTCGAEGAYCAVRLDECVHPSSGPLTSRGPLLHRTRT